MDVVETAKAIMSWKSMSKTMKTPIVIILDQPTPDGDLDLGYQCRCELPTNQKHYHIFYRMIRCRMNDTSTVALEHHIIYYETVAEGVYQETFDL